MDVRLGRLGLVGWGQVSWGQLILVFWAVLVGQGSCDFTSNSPVQTKFDSFCSRLTCALVTGQGKSRDRQRASGFAAKRGRLRLFPSLISIFRHILQSSTVIPEVNLIPEPSAARRGLGLPGPPIRPLPKSLLKFVKLFSSRLKTRQFCENALGKVDFPFKPFLLQLVILVLLSKSECFQ